MNNALKLAMAASAIAFFAGCEADGGFGTGTGGPTPGAGDEDGDGVSDVFDLCPGTDEGATVDANGCSTDQYGAALPTGAVCTAWRSGTATAAAQGNLCELSPVLDPILGILGTGTCFVTDEQNAADGNPESFASMTNTAALLDPSSLGFPTGTPLDGNVSITVDGIGNQGAGSVAAFDVVIPGGTADVGVLNDIRVDTLLDGNVVETATGNADTLGLAGLVQLDLLGLLGSEDRFAVGFIASAPYNAIRISASATVIEADVGLDTSEANVFVHDACSDAQVPAE